ncbi:MAG TPA: hypothetical protein VG847_07740 [Chitinophagaceae bacterium]|nr:hypothetical protein [Chitinophagaceae bacterium]
MNYKPVKFFFIFILFCFPAGHSLAQSDSDNAAVEAQHDSLPAASGDVADTGVSKIFFESSGDSVKKWRQSPRFAYMAYIDSALRKKRGALKVDTFSFTKDDIRSFSKSASSEESSPGFLNSAPVKIFFWFIAVFFILYILYRVIFRGGLFERNKKRTEEAMAEEPEKLRDYDVYDKLIGEAEANNDYNLATRYLYLQSLKKLSDRELILFSPDKTNSAYIHELSGQIFQPAFGRLTMNYEYIWYGKFSVSRDRYLQLKNSFQSFNNQI